MTTDALGPCPPMNIALTPILDPSGIVIYTTVSPSEIVTRAYADYWRRRAERAEELLQKSRRWRDHDPRCSDHPGDKCLCGLLEYQARVAAHFAEVKP